MLIFLEKYYNRLLNRKSGAKGKNNRNLHTWDIRALKTGVLKYDLITL